MDKIIFGDNQFFGVNHMSEQKAIKQAQRFRTPEDIYKTLEYVNEIGIKSFIFTTHGQFEQVCKMMRDNPKFDDFKLYPSLPYAHKYVDALSEHGPFDAIRKFLPGNKILSGIKGLESIITSNPIPVMELLVDMEMKMLKGMNVQGIFLLNVITDLLLGLEMHDILLEFHNYVRKKYNVEAGYFTMNFTKLHHVLVDKLGLENPIIVSNINKTGFRMNPSQEEVEKVLAEGTSRNIAMSFLASGAILPPEASEYIGSLEGIDGVLYGASSKAHILETKEILEATFANQEALRSLKII